jgi:hypothetical protein
MERRHMSGLRWSREGKGNIPTPAYELQSPNRVVADPDVWATSLSAVQVSGAMEYLNGEHISSIYLE